MTGNGKVILYTAIVLVSFFAHAGLVWIENVNALLSIITGWVISIVGSFFLGYINQRRWLLKTIDISPFRKIFPFVLAMLTGSILWLLFVIYVFNYEASDDFARYFWLNFPIVSVQMLQHIGLGIFGYLLGDKLGKKTTILSA